MGKKPGLPSIEGHTKGAWNLFYLCDWCIEERINEITVFVFSTYNWNRTIEEIAGLFNLVDRIFRDKIASCVGKGIKVQIIGDTSKLDIYLQKTLYDFEYETQECNNVILNIAINYGGLEDIVYAIQSISSSPNMKTILDTLDRDSLKDYLQSSRVSNIDLLIRTGGYQRLSNFFLVQSSLAELYFTKTLWLDFCKHDFMEAMAFYRQTNINNGK